MVGGLTQKERDALAFINRYIKKTGGVAPCYNEIAEDMGVVSKSGVHRIVQQLIKKGVIHRHNGASRNYVITNLGEFYLPLNPLAHLFSPEEIERIEVAAHGDRRPINDFIYDAVITMCDVYEDCL